MEFQITGRWSVFFNNLFRLNTKKQSKFRITVRLWGDSASDRRIPHQKVPVMQIALPWVFIMKTCRIAIEVYIINNWHKWLRVCFDSVRGCHRQRIIYIYNAGCIKPAFVFRTFVYNGLSARSQVSNCSSRVNMWWVNGCYNSDNSILIGIILGIIVIYHDQVSVDIERDPVNEGMNRMLSWVTITIFELKGIWFSETFLTRFYYNGLTLIPA